MVTFIFMIALHFFSYFYLQSRKNVFCKTASNKAEREMCQKCRISQKCEKRKYINIGRFLLYSLFYVLPFGLIFFLTKWNYALCVIGIIFLAHFIIDFITCFFKGKGFRSVVLLVNQTFHILVLYVCYIAFPFTTMPENHEIFIKIALAGLFLANPSSAFVDVLFFDLFKEENEKGLFEISSMIGVMERIITFIFACVENYAAIAIIISIKTWARTQDLKEKEFRNKYILGTMASLVLALLGALLFKKLL